MSELQSRHTIGNVDFDCSSFAVAAESIMMLIGSAPTPGVAIHFANAYNIALSSSDIEYADILKQGDLVFMDGQPVVWAAKWLSRNQENDWARIYGPDMMVAILERCNQDRAGTGHYLLGGTKECLELLESSIRERWPNLKLVGAESPPFRPASVAELRERDERIRKSGAQVVWVGLGTPKQDYEVRRLADSLPITAIAVGAAFDFIAGTVSQAPVWVQKAGLEWAYRFAQEPRRLAKRYLWGNPVFIREVVRQRFGFR